MAIFNPRVLLARSSLQPLLRQQQQKINPRKLALNNLTSSPRRTFSQLPRSLARKDTQDKDSLKPEPNEYSKSGSDDAAAAVEDAAFDPNKTRPEEEHASAGRESGKAGQDSNPLDVSPANQEVSKARDPQEGGHEGSSAESGQGPSDRARTSGGGSPDKGSEGKRYDS